MVEVKYNSRRDPIHSAGLLEGDIIANLNPDGLFRNAIRAQSKKWPGATIPYVISSSFGAQDRSVIAKAMKSYHDKTCIRFIPRTSESDYIHLVKGSGCSSSIGREGGRQAVTLGSGCVFSGNSQTNWTCRYDKVLSPSNKEIILFSDMD